MNVKELKEIFRLVEKTDFTEVEISQGDWRLRVERAKGPLTTSYVTGMQPLMPSAAPSMPSPEEASSVPEASQGKEGEASEAKGVFLVTSPFVGTFYTAPSPDAEPYVRVGDRIKEGQSLCIIEAMKLMNEIESDYDGVIAEIFPPNGTPVEFGEKLFRIIPG